MVKKNDDDDDDDDGDEDAGDGDADGGRISVAGGFHQRMSPADSSIKICSCLADEMIVVTTSGTAGICRILQTLGLHLWNAGQYGGVLK